MLRNFSEERFDIIIQGGQSNCEGYGVGDVDNPYQPNENVWYLNQDFTITCAAEKVRHNEVQTTFGLSFVRKYLEENLLEEDRKLLIVRAAVGGTAFLNDHWKMEDDCYLRMMEMIHTALSLNKENRLVCFLWHQGEDDAVLNASFETHYNHLKRLVDSVRETFAVPELPFIAGDFVPDWKVEYAESSKPVLDAIRQVCKELKKATFVETEGLLSNRQDLGLDNKRGWIVREDSVHFSRKSCYLLGERYFEAFLNICEGKG